MKMTSHSGPKLLDTGLLVLRLGAGLSLFLFFGWTKLKDGAAFLHTGHWRFVDFNRHVGLPLPVLAAWYQTVNESLGALLVASGLFTRFAAASLAAGFAVAAFCSLKAKEPAWLDAAFYCLMFTTLLLTGPGAFSVDQFRQRTRGKIGEQAVDSAMEVEKSR